MTDKNKRDYKREYALEKPERRKKRAQRNKARRMMERLGKVHKGDGKDVDHVKPMSKGGKTTLGNLRVVSASDNRSYPRNPDRSMKKNI